ncbi:MAG: cell envelope integrity protein TolA [Syntrophorhabdales bacterium]|jgi:TonB family protein
MREDKWFTMFVISALLHVLILGALSIPSRKSTKRIDLTSYSVNLVGDIGDIGGGAGQAAKQAGAAVSGTTSEADQKTRRTIPAKAAPKARPAPPITKARIPVQTTQREQRAIVHANKRPVAQAEKREVSEHPIKKARIPVQTTQREQRAIVHANKRPVAQAEKREVSEHATKDEIRGLDEKIRGMKNRTPYLDVSGAGEGGKGQGTGGGLPVAGPGRAGSASDPALQRYMAEVWERIQDAWHTTPGHSFKASLETVVSIKIGRDGRILDMDIEHQSGSRVFDEAVLRTLRSIRELPALPSSLNEDSIDIGFNFHPPIHAR